MQTQAYCGFSNIQELAADTEALFAEAIAVPNSWVPPRYHQKSGEVSLAKIEKIYSKQVKPVIEENSHEQERLRRVELYAAQFAENGEFEYEEFVHDAPKSRKRSL